MSKLFKSIGVIIGFLAIFLVLAYGLYAIFKLAFPSTDLVLFQVLASIIADIAVSVCAVFYLKKHKDTSVIYERSKLLLFVPLLFVLWIFAQITTKSFVSLFPNENVSVALAGTEVSVLYVFLTLLFAPIGEELLFRGVIFRECKKVMALPYAYLISSLLFGFLHGNMTQLFLGFFAGFFFAVVYEYTHNLLCNIFFHFLFNLFSLLCGGLPLPDFFGYPAVFITVDLIIVGVLVFIAYFVWFRRNDSLLSHRDEIVARNDDVYVRRIVDKHDF